VLTVSSIGLAGARHFNVKSSRLEIRAAIRNERRRSLCEVIGALFLAGKLWPISLRQLKVLLPTRTKNEASLPCSSLMLHAVDGTPSPATPHYLQTLMGIGTPNPQ
jgi:hypothetical protein